MNFRWPECRVSGLIAYWIVSPLPHAPLGFGVTAWSPTDALEIICAFDYGRFLPDDLNTIRVTANVGIADLDQRHVVPHMGPIVNRGMWYPFVAVGVPRWAENRLT